MRRPGGAGAVAPRRWPPVTSERVVRVVVIGADASLRRAVREALADRADVELVAEADGSPGAVAVATAGRPDVVVLEPGPAGPGGGELVATLRAQAPDARIVVLSGNVPGRRTAYAWGAGPVVRDVDLEHLTRVVRVPGPQPEAGIELPGDSSSVAAARRFVAATLEAWGCGEVVGPAVLVTSELVTNAWRHAGAGCRLRLVRQATVVRIEVADAAPSPPEPRRVAEDDEGGRGLLIVSALSAAWGVDPAERGKVTWAELLLIDR